MKKITKLRICNRSLLPLLVLMLLSGLQLEIQPSGNLLWVLVHIFVGMSFMGLIMWHIVLNRSKKSVNKPVVRKGVRWLALFFVFTLISAIIATVHWLNMFHHSSIGGIHGKLGFIFIILIVRHIYLHRKFYK